MVAVVDEQVEGGQAQYRTGLDHLPPVARNYPRDDVERPPPVDAHTFVVVGERDTDGADLAIGGQLTLGRCGRTEFGEMVPQLLGRGPRRHRRADQFDEERCRVVRRPGGPGGIGIGRRRERVHRCFHVHDVSPIGGSDALQA